MARKPELEICEIDSAEAASMEGLRIRKFWIAAVAVGILLAGAAVASTQSQAPALKPFTAPLTCLVGVSTTPSGPQLECPLLTGPPQTVGLHSGIVRLPAGDDVGWHSTSAHEEELVILQGTGEADFDGQPALPVGEGVIVYIPPQTRHDVKNTGINVLEYVYVVAPVAASK